MGTRGREGRQGRGKRGGLRGLMGLRGLTRGFFVVGGVFVVEGGGVGFFVSVEGSAVWWECDGVRNKSRSRIEIMVLNTEYTTER